MLSIVDIGRNQQRVQCPSGSECSLAPLPARQARDPWPSAAIIGQSLTQACNPFRITMPLTTHIDRQMATWLAAELADVAARFSAEVASDVPCVNTLVAHVERFRGKMLRPTLVLASGLASAPLDTDLLEGHRILATVVEMVHLGTLVHDDILDEAEVRRRGPTLNHLSGNETAVMLGDYLVSHAYHLCSSLDDPRLNRVLAEATNAVCEGELLQLANRDNWALDERTYFQIIRHKTASLCGACCRLGAMLSEAPPRAAEALYEYGEKVGMAFQIVDDLLDLVGDQNTVGKTLGRDIDKGKLTLPLIHGLRVARPETRQMLLAVLQQPVPGDNGRGRGPAVRELIASTDSIAYSQQWAARLVAEARAALDHVAPSPTRTLLAEMAAAVIHRQS
jgi:octaprenyl-diphosphate synthase